MTSRNITIREAKASDLDAMVGLLRQLFAIEDDFVFNDIKQRHGLAALIADRERSTIQVAMLRSTVVGMCTAQINISTAEGGLTAHIEDMVVDSTVRGVGIGTALLDTIGNWAESRGCLRLQLLADKRNEKALRFYHRAGWSMSHMMCLTRTFNCSSYSYRIHRARTHIPAGGTSYAARS